MKSKLYQDENYLRYLHYELHMLPSEIAKMFDVSQSLIHHYFRKFGIEYDKTLSNLKHRKYQCDHYYFNVIDTPTQAYWLGFIMADGNIDNRKDRKNTHRLTIRLAKSDEHHLEKLNTVLNSNYEITYPKTEIKGKEYELAQLRINSSILCNGLIVNGIKPAKSCNEVFPYNTIPREYWKHFIRGVFDGDGCFSWWFDQDRYIPSCSFSLCGSQQLLLFCFTYIEYCTGVRIPKITKKDNNLYTATIGGNFNVQKIMNWLYYGSSDENRLDRKYDKYHEFLEEYNNPRYDEYKRKSNVYV